MTPHRARARKNIPVLLALLGGVAFVSACTSSDSTGTSVPGSLALVPSFQIVAGDLGAEPVDRIAMVARDTTSVEVVGVVDETVDPGASSWSITLDIDLGGASSRTVIVDIELYGMGSVQWSGRLGPVTVTGSPSGSIRQVDVYRGPLDNLDVQDVQILTAPTQLEVGASAGATATVTLRPGSSAQPQLFWGSLDDAVATVDFDSLGAATVTGVAAGTVTIVAAAGPVVDSASVEVVAQTPIPAGYDILWLGVADGDWNNGGNWTGGAPPGPADNVYVGVGPTPPAIPAGTIQVGGDLAVGAGASVDFRGGTLEVAGDLALDGNASGTGSWILAGAAAQMSGTTSLPVTVTGGVTTAGTVTTGALTVQGAFTVPSGGAVTIAGQLVLASGSSLTVDGSVTATGGCVNNGGMVSGSGTNPCPLPLAVWLGGAAGAPTDWGSGDNWSIGQVPDGTYAIEIPVTGNDPVSLGGGLDVGALTMAEGATLDLNDGVLSVEGAFQTGTTGVINGTVVFTGSSGVTEGTADNFQVRAPRTLSGTLSSVGTVVVDNTTLDVAAGTLEAFDLFVQGGIGRLAMQDGSTVDLGGSAFFDGGVSSGWLTGGVMTVGGNFSASSTNTPLSFVADAAHTVIFAGITPTLDFSAPGPTQQRFGSVAFSTEGAATTLSNVAATGSFIINDGSGVDAADDSVMVGGSLVDDGVALVAGALVITGDLSEIPGIVNADLVVRANFNLPNPIQVNGSVTVDNFTFASNGQTANVTGDVLVQGANGRIDMRLGGLVDIDGNATFAGAFSSGFLNGGTIRLAGNFTALSTASPLSFAASTGHTLILDGTGPQTLFMEAPATTQQRFFDLTIENTSDVITFASDIAVLGTFTIPAGGFVDAVDDALTVAGAFVDGSDGTQLRELVVAGDLSVIPTSIPGDLTVQADFNAPSNFFVSGNLTLDDRDLLVGGATIQVFGDLLVTGTNAQLRMTNPAGVLEVEGSAVFDGGAHVNALTAGELIVGGDFTATNADLTAFWAGGSHTTTFDGIGLQTIALANPELNGHRFAGLNVENFNLGVAFSSSVVVTDTLFASDVALLRDAAGAAAGAVLDIRGTAYFDAVNVEGLPVRIESAVEGPLHFFSNVTFTGMDPGDVQIDVVLPGLGANSPLVLEFVTFDQVAFTTGLYLRTTRGSGIDDLYVQVVSPIPNDSGGNVLQGLNTFIFWPS